jgi:hypothetical protein
MLEDTLIRLDQIVNLQRPTQRQLRGWKEATDHRLADTGGERLEDANKYSMCSLTDPRPSDPVSGFLRDHLSLTFSVSSHTGS